MADDDFESQSLPNLEQAVENGTRLEVLRAIAAIAAHELAGNRCQKCHMSYMKTGEISSLMLRLQKVYEDIEALESDLSRQAEFESPDKPKKRGLRDIKSDRTHLQVVGEDETFAFGTKSAPRRQGGRRPRT